MISGLRKIYRKYIHWPFLDQLIYKFLDGLTDAYSAVIGYSFPSNYIRRWKLDMLWELYEPETVTLCKKIIKPGMNVVDIGAHIGYFTRIFSKLTGKNGKVYAFEADPENFNLLQKNTISLKNTKNYQLAITDRAGAIDFYHCETKAGCHSILKDIPLNYPKKKITVKAEKLDDFVKKENLKKIDLIKMDIEGGEAAALKGMENTLKANANLILLIEFAPAWVAAAGVQPADFLQNLASFGFKIFAITPKELIGLLEKDFKNYQNLIPKSKDGSAFGEFVNLYCIKEASISIS
jgi:FkbM family methyltransferase